MDRFHAMQLFTRIVDLGSFTRAAEDLQLPRATVSHAVQQLEKRLGVRLLQRTTRHVSTTQDGAAYYERCIRLLGDLEETESVFAATGSKPKGRLRVDLHGTMARHFIFPVISNFFERYPDIELDIGLGDRLVDLVREGVDCVMRSGGPGDTGMVARRVASLEMVTCASRSHIVRHGLPDSIEAFRHHRAVNFQSTRTGKALPFDFLVDGAARSVQLKGPVTVSDADAYHACCEAGMGFIQSPRYPIEPLLKSGALVEVLAPFRPAPMQVSVMYPYNRQLSPRVRVFVEWLAEVMAKAN